MLAAGSRPTGSEMSAAH